MSESNGIDTGPETGPPEEPRARSRWSRVATSWGAVAVFSVLIIGAALVAGNMMRESRASVPTHPSPLGLAADHISHAPDFQIAVYQGSEALGGDQVRFSDLLAQGKPVVLNFWAGQCPPCRVEMPHLDELASDYQDRILVLGLDVGPFVGLGTREEGQALVEELGVTFPAGTTYDPQVVRDYQVMGMPTTLFVSPDGRVVRQWSGLITRDRLEQLTEDLLERS